jgi:hypothetical protein
VAADAVILSGTNFVVVRIVIVVIEAALVHAHFAANAAGLVTLYDESGRKISLHFLKSL